MIKHHKTNAYSLFVPFNNSQKSTTSGIILISPNVTQAQYRGGSNDGTSWLQPKGIQHPLPEIYSGGPNDGHAANAAPAQHFFPGIYFGGTNDGIAAVQAKGSQNASPGIYAGGADDGVSIAGGRLQNALPGIYSGGSDDGFAAASVVAMNMAPPIYLGGMDDGTDMSSGKGPTNLLPAIYAGGADDGYSFIVSLSQNAGGSQPPIVRDQLRTVPLLQLSGTWFNDDAVLAWTSAETGTAQFELQRSENGGSDFSTIGSAAPNAEAGQHDYRYTDVRAYHLQADYLLYRLKCTDAQGAFRYSAVVRLSSDRTAPVIVAYPNPTSGRFTLAMLNVPDFRGYSYMLSSAEGKIIKRGIISEAATSFDLSGCASAAYRLFLFKDGKPIQHFSILLTQ